MRKQNPNLRVADVIGDAIDELNPATAIDEALAIIESSNLKHRLDTPRRIAGTHQRRAITLHESAHAMAALIGGAESINVLIREDGSGLCVAPGIAQGEAAIIYSLAGCFAEVQFDAPAIHKYTQQPCADFLIARWKIDALNASRVWPQMTARMAAKLAMRFVEQHLPAIQNLALALADGGELDDYSVRLFARCSQ